MGKKNKNKKRKRSVPDSSSSSALVNDDGAHQESIPPNGGPLVVSSTSSTKDAPATTSARALMDPTEQSKKKKKRKRKKQKIEEGAPAEPKETTDGQVEESAAIVPKSKFGVVLSWTTRRRLWVVKTHACIEADGAACTTALIGQISCKKDNRLLLLFDKMSMVVDC